MPSMQTDQQTQIDNSSIQIIDYLEVVVRYKKMIVYTTLSAFCSAVIITLLMTKIYSSTALMAPPQQDAGMLGLLMGGASGSASFASDLLGKGTSSDLYASILKSEAIKDQLIDRFKLIDVYKQKYRMDTYKRLDKATLVEVEKKSGIISISVLDKDPKRAADMANAYVEELGKLTVEMNTTDAFKSKTFLENRLAKVKSDLSRTEDALKIFQLKHKSLDISEQAKGSIKGIAELEGQLATEEVKLAGIRQRLTDNSQEVKNQRTIVTNLKLEIAKFEGVRSASAIPGIGTMPTIGQEYMRLMRDFKTQEMILEMLTKQYEMTKFNEANTNSNIQVIQKAKIADKKTKPKRAILVLAATFTAFMLTTFLAFIFDLVGRMPTEQRNNWKRILFCIFSNKSIIS